MDDEIRSLKAIQKEMKENQNLDVFLRFVQATVVDLQEVIHANT
jgi:hypothetical protein